MLIVWYYVSVVWSKFEMCNATVVLGIEGRGGVSPSAEGVEGLAKCKKSIGWPLVLCTLSSAQPLVIGLHLGVHLDRRDAARVQYNQR